MFVACSGGHLNVAQWLFEAGAADDIRSKDNNGMTPLCNWGFENVTCMLGTRRFGGRAIRNAHATQRASSIKVIEY